MVQAFSVRLDHRKPPSVSRERRNLQSRPQVRLPHRLRCAESADVRGLCSVLLAKPQHRRADFSTLVESSWPPRVSYQQRLLYKSKAHEGGVWTRDEQGFRKPPNPRSPPKIPESLKPVFGVVTQKERDAVRFHLGPGSGTQSGVLNQRVLHCYAL